MKTYRQFVKESAKGVDAWTEVFFFDIISNPFGYLFYLLSGNSLLVAYLLTALTFVLMVSSAVAFFLGSWFIGWVLYLIAAITDNIDGKVARMINKVDPPLRSTTDFIGDMIAISLIYFAMAYHLVKSGDVVNSYWVILFMSFMIIYMTATSSKFRTQGLSNIPPNAKLKESLGEKNTRRFSFLFDLQKKFSKWRIPFYPSACEAKFLMTFIFPLVQSPIVIAAAILILIIDIFASGLFPVYALLTKK